MYLPPWCAVPHRLKSNGPIDYGQKPPRLLAKINHISQAGLKPPILLPQPPISTTPDEPFLFISVSDVSHGNRKVTHQGKYYELMAELRNSFPWYHILQKDKYLPYLFKFT